MNQTGNINIISNYGSMNYIVTYENTQNYISKDQICISNINENENIIQTKILNTEFDNNLLLEKRDLFFVQNKNFDNDKIPRAENINLSNLIIKFPQFSVDIYDKNTSYAVTANIWINNTNIFLGSYSINRSNAIALPQPERYLNNNYYEYISVPIINPLDIIYKSSWEEFRRNICHTTSKSTCAVLNVTLYPIEQNGTSYSIKNNYTGALCSINMNNNEEDNALRLKLNFLETPNPHYECKIHYNKKYNSTKFKTDFQVFCEDVQHIFISNEKPSPVKIELAIMDDKDLFKSIVKEVPIDSIKNGEAIIKFKKENTPNFEPDKLCWPAWYTATPVTLDGKDSNRYYTLNDNWHEGIFIKAFLHIEGETIVHKETGREKCIYEIASNSIPLTIELMKYFIYDGKNKNGEDFISQVDLNKNDDMIIQNINAVNKIVNEVIKVDNTTIGTLNSNFIKPIFYSVQPTKNIIIHLENENICINLNSIKNQVKIFKLKIENNIFNEIGRTVQGVIFSIDGKKIINKNDKNDELSGTYYILNENNEFVTSGHYQCSK